MTEPTQLIEQLVGALERIHLWADSQADAQSKGGHATFDLMHLREERDALIPALTTARAHLEQPTEPEPSTAGDQEDKIVNLPIPASASDLKSDIVELIQSHKYKGLRSIEVLGVFQFLGAEIISGSNS